MISQPFIKLNFPSFLSPSWPQVFKIQKENNLFSRRIPAQYCKMKIPAQ